MKQNCISLSNYTEPEKSEVQLIELNQCPPELLVITKNNNHGGNSYDALLNQNGDSYKQTIARFESIDLQNGGYLFFLNMQRKSDYFSAGRQGSESSQYNYTNVGKMRDDPSAKYYFEIFLLSSNCNAMYFPPKIKQNRPLVRRAIQKLSHHSCLATPMSSSALMKESGGNWANGIFPRTIRHPKINQTYRALPYGLFSLGGSNNATSRFRVPISMPNLHFVGDSTLQTLFKYIPYYMKNLGMFKSTKEPLHEATYYHFYTLFLSLVTKWKHNETQIVAFSNSINDISSDVHSDYFMSLGETLNRLILNLYTMKPFANYKVITILLNGPMLTLHNNLDCKNKLLSIEEEAECLKVVKYYSHERMNLLNDVYDTITLTHGKRIHILNVSHLTRESLEMDNNNIRISNLMPNSRTRDSIWKLLLKIALKYA